MAKTIRLNWLQWKEYCAEHDLDPRECCEDGIDLGGGHSLNIICSVDPPEEEDDIEEKKIKKFSLSSDWLCECGKRPFEDGIDKWRWDGENWQHYHEYPIGHVIAEYKLKK